MQDKNKRESKGKKDTTKKMPGVSKQVRAKVTRKAPPPVIPFGEVLWSGIKPVYRCKCGECRDDIDSIITHCLTHYPENEQERMLEIMLAKEL